MFFFNTKTNSDRYLASNIIEAPIELRKTILQISRKEIEPVPRIFDDLQKKVEKIIEKEVYPAFLMSDIFIEFVQSRQDEGITVEIANETNTLPTQIDSSSASGLCSSNSSSRTDITASTAPMTDGHVASAYNLMNADLISPIINASNLQTLHEDSELKLNAESHSTKSRTEGRPMLTKELLLATQKGRLEVRPQG